jgi:hypothetical protein
VSQEPYVRLDWIQSPLDKARSDLNEKVRQLYGRTITAGGVLSKAEARACGWDENEWPPQVYLQLDDGTVLSVLRDPEGNGPGWLSIVK